jgi:prophage DNA circulation protein
VYEMGQPLKCDTALQRLDFCYEQLLSVISDTQSKPEQILELVNETTALIAGLTAELEKTGEVVPRVQLEKVFHKLQQVIAVTVNGKNQVYRAMMELKTGKQAINSYRPPAVGMGYTEGKFLDQKK